MSLPCNVEKEPSASRTSVAKMAAQFRPSVKVYVLIAAKTIIFREKHANMVKLMARRDQPAFPLKRHGRRVMHNKRGHL